MMNEKLLNLKTSVVGFWGKRQKKQKVLLVGAVVAVILVIVGASLFSAKPTLEPLYTNLTPSETGTIKENLDSRGITSEIADGGTSLSLIHI